MVLVLLALSYLGVYADYSATVVTRVVETVLAVGLLVAFRDELDPIRRGTAWWPLIRDT